MSLDWHEWTRRRSEELNTGTNGHHWMGVGGGGGGGGGVQPGLDSPGKTHGDDSLVPAWPKTMPGVPRHFAL